MKLFNYLWILIICIPVSIFGQNTSKYNDYLQEVNEFFMADEYPDALPLLLELENSNLSNPNINYKIGLCYLNSIAEKVKSITYLENASSDITANYKDEDLSETKAPVKSVLLLGDAYRVNNRLDEAEQAYKRYLSLTKEDDQAQMVSEKKIFECQIAKLFLKRQVEYHFDKLSNQINTGIGNFNACISGDGKSMVFNRKMKFYDAIYFSTRKENGWADPEEITTPISSDGNFRPTGLSPDGKRMLLVCYNQTTGYDIYESICKNGKWGKAIILNNTINSPFHDIDAIYSQDGKSIYFSSNRSGGYGGFDIYKATIDDNGKIYKVNNLGSTVNTEWNEKSPTLLDNGKTLVFSSQKKPCMGGYDFFYSRINTEGKWDEACNMGFPLSTIDDDMGLSTTLQEKEGLLSKWEPGSNAEKEIFHVQYNILPGFRLIPMSGEIHLTNDSKPTFKNINLLFIDQTIKDTIGVVKNPEGGRYKLELYPGDFQMVVIRDNQVSYSQKFTIREGDDKALLVSQITTPEDLSKTSLTATIDTLMLTDILFKFGKSTFGIQEESKIKDLIAKINKHKITKIELRGFADNIGSDKYNQKLSEQRAGNVWKYLTEKGIPKEIITTKGFGSALNVAINANPDGSDNPDGRMFNRRVEIRITTDDSGIIVIRKDLIPDKLKP